MDPILPGSAVGVLGSGQLGRMFAIAARQMGYRVHTFSPDTDTPTGQVADVEVTAAYDDLDRVRDFAGGVKVVTFEFENVPAATAAAAAERAPVRPAGDVLHTTQQRLREKTFLARNGFPVTAFRAVRSPGELRAAATGPRPTGASSTTPTGITSSTCPWRRRTCRRHWRKRRSKSHAGSSSSLASSACSAWSSSSPGPERCWSTSWPPARTTPAT
jgi:hypothetical protein